MSEAGFLVVLATWRTICEKRWKKNNEDDQQHEIM
jgi:hypothetical protein